MEIRKEQNTNDNDLMKTFKVTTASLTKIDENQAEK